MNRKRVNVTFKVNLKYPDRDTFAERFAQNISHTGIFVRAQDPLPVGSRVTFDYRLSDGACILRGSGVVRWTRLPAEAKEPHTPPGMGIEYLDLDAPTELLIGQIVAKFGEGARAPKGPAQPDDTAESLARQVAEEDTSFEFTDMAPEPSVSHAVLVIDLASSDITVQTAHNRHTMAPRLRIEAGRPNIHGRGTYLPNLAAWLGEAWPSPVACAMARRLDVQLAAAPHDGIAVVLAGSAVPVVDLLQVVLAKALPQPLADSVVAVVPDTLNSAGAALLVEALHACGVTNVQLLPAAEAMAAATEPPCGPDDLAACIKLGPVSCSVALVQGTGVIRPAFLAADLGLWEADACLTRHAAMELLKQGVDITDDASKMRALQAQVATCRRRGKTPWKTEHDGRTCTMAEPVLAQNLALLCERVGLLCATMLRNHTPQGRQVKHLIIASDEPLWPGLLEYLQEQFDLTPCYMQDGPFSLASGAWAWLQPNSRPHLIASELPE